MNKANKHRNIDKLRDICYHPQMGQSLHQIYGHLVFSTKGRKPLINPTIELKLYHYISGIIKSLDSHVLEINGMPDHIHILFRMSKKVSDIDFIQQVKGGSSRWMSQEGVSNFHWQSGYGWFSVSHRNLAAAETYIRNQKEHHQKVSFQDELRGILNAYQIEYDEKYLWD